MKETAIQKNREIKFTVPGVPVGYLRMTQGQVKLMRIPYHKLYPAQQKIMVKISKYLNYKAATEMTAAKFKFDRSPTKANKIYLHVMIFFKNGIHPDPENVRKGIQDALFVSDKHVSGCYDYDYDAENPRCEIIIITET